MSQIHIKVKQKFSHLRSQKQKIASSTVTTTNAKSTTTQISTTTKAKSTDIASDNKVQKKMESEQQSTTQADSSTLVTDTYEFSSHLTFEKNES